MEQPLESVEQEGSSYSMYGKAIHVLHLEVRLSSVVPPEAFQYVINPQRPAIICSVA